ncbi:flavohemoglobin expression-modulating QEGLA motif protein [Ahniella affigens]|uniref:Flavohemoglobin expression-modulating QEGLA motif protein n=1 Tax=Ahniella affigens TaxID=2021234 RepID=A0A2P1PX56_9GAMM|nr:flavohemoglobin expression-modulating QEGLA motif protein [Ahniella affigens]AVP99422.1 flavohemoglobin expression-modulating QEGLA motif protein [Ahniella affigens]
MNAVPAELGSAADLRYFAELDKRLVDAVRGIRMLDALSWPASLQHEFLAAWHRGQPFLPEVRYKKRDFTEIRAELDAIQHEARFAEDHPVGGYVRRTAESWEIATAMLDAAGTADIGTHSARLFGQPGDFLPGSEHHNVEAALHFISLADELSHELSSQEADYCLSAQIMQQELQERLDAFFVHHKVRVEIDPELTAKAAAGPTRIRLRNATCFSEYDRHQLLEHEAFVHSLTALNGREQPNLASMARNSPRITSTQEGLATFAELITGTIDIGRMKRISMRIIGIDKAQDGANFIDVFKLFMASGQTESEAYTSAARIFRGAPTTGGSAFTKDTVYLHGLLSVHTFFRWALKNQKLKLCRNLFAGKMTLHDVVVLEPWFDAGYITAPLYLPPWVQRANGLAGMLAFSLFANKIRLDRVQTWDLNLGV